MAGQRFACLDSWRVAGFRRKTARHFSETCLEPFPIALQLETALSCCFVALSGDEPEATSSESALVSVKLGVRERVGSLGEVRMDPEIFADVSARDTERTFAWFLVMGGFALAACAGVTWLAG